MTFYVYMLINNQNDKIISYVGWTNNLEQRILKHNSGAGAKFTRGRKWKIIYSKKYNSKSKALREEYKLKKNQKKRKIIKQNYLSKYEETT